MLGLTYNLHAFRQFPVHPDDWELIGMYWNNSIWFAVCAVYFQPTCGCSRVDFTQQVFYKHIVDDFLIMEPPAKIGTLSGMLLTNYMWVSKPHHHVSHSCLIKLLTKKTT